MARSRDVSQTSRPLPISNRFRQYLLPGIVFQSVLIGGAYATGREIVEYGARFGVSGIWSIIAIAAGFSLMAALSFEFARVCRVYDYRRFVRSLIGPLWPVFDLIYVLMVLVTIAVVSAAGGRVVEEVLGLSYWVGVGIVIAVVASLEIGGRRLIERFKTIGSVFLYGGFAIFAGCVLWQRWEHVAAAFMEGSLAFAPAAVGTGILYVGYNLAAIPATLFVLDYQSERRHTLIAGIITGLLATVPFVLTYLAVMGYYPGADVLDAEVPWLVMLRGAGGTMVSVYAGVILWTLVETSAGMIHAVLRRVDTNLEELGRRRLTRVQTGVVTGSLLIGAAVLSRVGLIALVARGYGALAYGFLFLFALPLLTVGFARLVRGK